MNYEQLKKWARAMLVLYHGINKPTERQIAMYMLYGGAEQ